MHIVSESPRPLISSMRYDSFFWSSEHAAYGLLSISIKIIGYDILKIIFWIFIKATKSLLGFLNVFYFTVDTYYKLMKPDSQNVIDYTNNTTIFMVWRFKDNPEVRDVFSKLCKLVINLNNSANVRFPVSRASCAMGVGHDAWLKLKLPVPLPKEQVDSN